MAIAEIFDSSALLLTLTVAHSERADIVPWQAPILQQCIRQVSFLWPTRWGRAVMVDSAGFMSGVWCGVILGAAGMLLVVSLVIQNASRKQERRLQRVREIWR